MNTKFFHQSATTRKRRNKIARLKNDDGSWVENQVSLCNLIANYFTNLFLPTEVNVGDYSFLDPIGRVITVDQNQELTRDFSIKEFKEALFQMHPDKSPGPDGFFQNCWDMVGEDVFRNGVKWLQDGYFPSGLNNTNLVLIPKVETPQSVKDLRPISLCNVLYKIVSKVLCNRLKEVLPGLVDKAQSAFVSGRAIQDNVLIAFEIIHAMKNRRSGDQGDVALKIDISKAYDRVDWTYLERIL